MFSVVNAAASGRSALLSADAVSTGSVLNSSRNSSGEKMVDGHNRNSSVINPSPQPVSTTPSLTPPSNGTILNNAINNILSAPSAAVLGGIYRYILSS